MSRQSSECELPLQATTSLDLIRGRAAALIAKASPERDREEEEAATPPPPATAAAAARRQGPDGDRWGYRREYMEDAWLGTNNNNYALVFKLL